MGTSSYFLFVCSNVYVKLLDLGTLEYAFYSFLIEEWSYLRQQVALSDLIEDAIWNVLPGRIDEKIIAVYICQSTFDVYYFF